MPPISVMMKPASGSCNMTCDYCFYCDEQVKRNQASYGMMEEETLKNVMRKMILHAEGYCSIAFQGGEPTLRRLEFFKKAVEYGNKYNKKGIQLSYAFQTNGTNLTDEWCEFFHKYHFLVGISLDGGREQQDKNRHFHSGESTFERIMEVCALLDRYQVEYNILTVVNGRTAGDGTAIYDFFKKKHMDYQQYIPCLDPLFEAPGQKPFSLLPKAYGEFLITLFDRWYEDWKRGRQPYIRQFDNYIGILKGYAPESCDQRGCCSIQYVVEADGSVYPCDFYMLDAYRLGNVNTDTVAGMDERRKEIGFLEKSYQISETCKTCQYYGLCRSGCQRSRIKEMNGTYRSYFCKSYEMFFDACLKRMEEIAREI